MGLVLTSALDVPSTVVFVVRGGDDALAAKPARLWTAKRPAAVRRVPA